MARFLPLLMLVSTVVLSYAAAFNRMRAPLLLLASLLTALLVLSVVVPALSVRKLLVTRQMQQRGQAGERLNLVVEVRNQGWLPRLMVRVCDRWHRTIATGAASPDSPTELALGLLPYLAPREVRTLRVTVESPQRGAWAVGPVQLACSFPLGVVQRKVTSDQSASTLLVRPRTVCLEGLPLHGSSLETHRPTLVLPTSAGADEASGIRAYRAGDPLKHIHWRASAHRGELLVREFEALASARVCVVLDLHPESNVGLAENSSTEQAISLAASVVEYCVREDIPMRLAAAGPSAPELTHRSESEREALLDWLAAVSVSSAEPLPLVVQDLAHSTHAGETVLILVSTPETRHRPLLAALYELQDRGACPVVVLLSREDCDAAHQAEFASLVEASGIRCLQPGAQAVRPGALT